MRFFVLFSILPCLAAGNAGEHDLDPIQPNSNKKLVVAISLDIPPYVMQRATKGLEVDLVKRALKGYSLQFVQMPYQDLQTAISQNKADVAVGVQPAKDSVFYSGNFITFHNAAISKKTDGIKINRVADLKDHEVLTWQNAYLELGPEFKELFSPASPSRKNYHEVADQRNQVEEFWRGKGKVVVIDRVIFRYFSREMGHKPDESVIHAIFPPVTGFRVGFKNEGIRDTFDRQLADLRANREYGKLLELYHIEPADDSPRDSR
jgi:polar amino acid transport system substrate-binding protein